LYNISRYFILKWLFWGNNGLFNAIRMARENRYYIRFKKISLVLATLVLLKDILTGVLFGVFYHPPDLAWTGKPDKRAGKQ
jgi:hypothetical protein